MSKSGHLVIYTSVHEMASPNVVRAKWAKGKSELFCMTSSGSFSGFMYPAGYALSLNPDPKAPVATDMLLVTCKNPGKSRWTTAAISRTPFKDIPPNTSFPCEFVLIFGPIQDESTQDLEVTYLPWRADLPPSFNLGDEMRSHRSPRTFVEDFFEAELKSMPMTDVHIRGLNQVSGPVFPSWKWEPDLAWRKGRWYHQMSQSADRWMTGWGGFQPRKLITAPHSNTPIPGVWYTTSVNDFISKTCHTKKIVQFCNSKTMVIYTKFIRRDDYFGQFCWVPMVSSRPGYRRFAVIYQQSKNILDSYIARQDNQSMDPEDFDIELEEIVFNTDMDIVELPILHCGGTYFGYRVVNFVSVVMVQDGDPTSFGAHHVGKGCWILFLDRNCDDLRIPGCGVNAVGVVSGRHSVYPKAMTLTAAHKKLLQATFPKAGMKRSRTTHEGSFYMCGKRRGCISSASMSQVSPSNEHHYYDERTMNCSLLSFAHPIIKELAWQAISVRDVCGQVQMGICRAAILRSEGDAVRSYDLAPQILLTGPLKELSFSNTEHIDSEDCMDETTNDHVYDYVASSKCQALIDSVGISKSIFKHRIMIEGDKKKKRPDKWRYHLPTTCVWSPINDPSASPQPKFKHVQYFVLPEGGISWDLSCNVFSKDIPQVTGTFMSGIISHVTSCSIWVDQSSGKVTTLHPGHGANANMAWGSNPKKKNQARTTRSGRRY